MKTSLMDRCRSAFSRTSHLEGDVYPQGDLRLHYLRAIIHYVESERKDNDSERYKRTSVYYNDLPLEERRSSLLRDCGESPKVNFDKYGAFSIETLKMISQCRRPGMYAFLVSLPTDTTEENIRNVMRFMMDYSEEQRFQRVMAAITEVKRSFQFHDSEDYGDLKPHVWRGVRAAIKFFIDHPSIQNYVPIAAEPVMRNPECADMVAQYFESRFPELVHALGFDLEGLYEYLENPAPSLAAGAL